MHTAPATSVILIIICTPAPYFEVASGKDAMRSCPDMFHRMHELLLRLLFGSTGPGRLDLIK